MKRLYNFGVSSDLSKDLMYRKTLWKSFNIGGLFNLILNRNNFSYE